MGEEKLWTAQRRGQQLNGRAPLMPWPSLQSSLMPWQRGKDRQPLERDVALALAAEGPGDACSATEQPDPLGSERSTDASSPVEDLAGVRERRPRTSEEIRCKSELVNYRVDYPPPVLHNGKDLVDM
uniref:Uncharacterized protein n=1 Tax=Oryza sativa subsp. japonica TaxID=39947 RepID=Q7XI24_ORYSJ|nr:hypothetical protein [Oryza sativa Japonica Group]BAD30191.1 hypothetical protein [Oryza sativa Japonica Group]